MKHLEEVILGWAYGFVLGESSNMIYGLTPLEREEVEKFSIDRLSLNLKDVPVLEESNPKRKCFDERSKKLKISSKAFNFSNTREKRKASRLRNTNEKESSKAWKKRNEDMFKEKDVSKQTVVASE